MSSPSFRLAAVALLLATAACADRGATGPMPGAIAGRHDSASPVRFAHDADPFSPHREVTVDTIDLAGSTVAVPCGEDGYTEMMQMEGKIFVRTQDVRDEAGGFHSIVHSMPVGLRGIGLESGAEYRLSEHEHGNFNDNGMGRGSSYQIRLSWHAPALRARGTWVLTSHFTVNANGDLVRERSELRTECRA